MSWKPNCQGFGSYGARLLASTSAACMLTVFSVVGGSASAQEVADEPDDDRGAIIVTATKRETDLQSTPVTISALSDEFLSEANIQGFEDYVTTVPSLSLQGRAPGRNELYIRGISQGGPSFEASQAGPEPSAALYLDEQPITALGANLDVHVYDMERIEILPGPQGTLFGASAQSGAVRLITKKPELGAFDMGFDATASYTEDGEFNNALEGFVNIPLGDRAALRAVFFNVQDGGYIDGVSGVQVSPVDNGYGFGEVIGFIVDGPDPRFVENNQNDVGKIGFRLSARVEINDDWTVTASGFHQRLQVDGVFQHDPEENGDLNIVNLFPNERRDRATQAALVVEGRAGPIEIVYAAAHLDRSVDETLDFTDYSEVGAYQDFYTCDYYEIFYFQTGTVEDNCRSQVYGLRSNSDYKRDTHEIRFLTPGDERLRATAGVFYQKDSAFLDIEYLYPNGADPAILGGLFGLPGSPVLPDRDPTVSFVTQIDREKEEIAGFAEFTFDVVPDTFAVTGGVRYYDISQKFSGFNIGLALPFRDFSGFPELNEDGFIFKGNLAFTPSDDALFYYTYSEGYRPGGFNRTPGVQRDPDIPVPGNFLIDELVNHEAGFKLTLLGGDMQLNGAAYHMVRDNTQISVFDPSVSGATYTLNGPKSRTVGFETDFAIFPTPDITLRGAFSYNEAELRDEFVGLSGAVIASSGSRLPYAPKIQGNLSAKYEWTAGDLDFYARTMLRYSGKSVNRISDNPTFQDSYATGDLAVGVEFDAITAEAFVNNIWDERAELFIDDEFLGGRITPNRPRTFGIRLSYRP